jgi:cold shock CspA family protein
MMNLSKTYQGIITYYSNEKSFGFIDTEIQEGIFFYNDTSYLRGISRKELKEIHRFQIGDEVTFSVRNSTRGYEAYNLQFIKNQKIETLCNLINEKKELPGFLKKIGNNFFVKDKETYLFIRIKISIWETALDKIYESRINEPVFYSVSRKHENIHKMHAYLVDRLFDESYYILQTYKDAGLQTNAIITGKNKNGYFITLLDNRVSAFLNFKELENENVNLKKHDKIKVMINDLTDARVGIKIV